MRLGRARVSDGIIHPGLTLIIVIITEIINYLSVSGSGLISASSDLY